MTLYRPVNLRTGLTALPHDTMTGANLWIIGNGGFSLWRVELISAPAPVGSQDGRIQPGSPMIRITTRQPALSP